MKARACHKFDNLILHCIGVLAESPGGVWWFCTALHNERKALFCSIEQTRTAIDCVHTGKKFKQEMVSR